MDEGERIMPFAIGDVNRHNKGLNAKKKRQWIAVANSALKRCIDDGGTTETCDASAIRQANAAVKESKSMVQKAIGLSENLSDRVNHVRDAFYDAQNPQEFPSSPYVLDVFEDSVIIRGADNKFYRVTYTLNDGVATFAPSSDWVELKQEWVAASMHMRSIQMAFTRVQKMDDGRVGWRARANSGEKDTRDERLDVSIFKDFAANFVKVQEAVGRGESVPGMNPVHLDVAHYSFFVPKEHRMKARVGWPTKVWNDGKALMATGFFDDTPIGKAAAKSVLNMGNEQDEVKISVGFYPDWAKVAVEDEVLTYKGGDNVAHLDHFAMTSAPIDTDTSIIAEVTAMGETTTLEQDALSVLGDAELVKELEGARAEGKSQAAPDGAVIKAEDVQADAEETEEEQEDTEKAPTQAESAEPGPVAESEVTLGMLKSVVTRIADAVTERLSPVQSEMKALKDGLAEQQTQIEALATTEGEKIRAAIDSDGDWLTEILKGSVQHDESGVVKGKTPKPEEQELTADQGVMGALFPQS
jgi:hypothetical protein